MRGMKKREELDKFAFNQDGEDAGRSGFDTRLQVSFSENNFEMSVTHPSGDAE